MKFFIITLISLTILVCADISIYAPGNAPVDVGSNVKIKWEGKPKNTTKSVDLDLMSSSSSQLKSVSKIARNLGTGNRSYIWEVPDDIESGRYVIKMSGKGDEAYYGSYFEIRNPSLPEKISTTPMPPKIAKKPSQHETTKKSFGNVVSISTFNLAVGLFCISYLLGY